MTNSIGGFHGDLNNWASKLPTGDGKPFVLAYEHGTLSVELYAPRGVDAQTPHRRDEVYVVVRGNGWFVNGRERHRFNPGDLLFVKAGVEHRFEDFNDDLAVWVVFYGPDGGDFMNFSIRRAEVADHAEWLRMRRILWDDCPDDQQLREMDEILKSETEIVFVAERTGGGLCGFVEVSIRPWAIGYEPRRVGYIEGWYVDEYVRREGVGRALVESAEAWAKSKGCRQMASDAELWNVVSHQAHGSLGYEETGRLVLFKKDLDR